MEINIKNGNITIICDLETAFLTGEAYHNVKIYQNNIKMREEHVHCCDNGYEAIFHVINKLPDSDYKEAMNEVVAYNYICYAD